MNIIDTLSTEIFALISSAVSASIAYIAGKRQANAQVKASELDNVHKAAQIWRELNEKLSEEINHLREANGFLKNEVCRLEQEVRELKAYVNKAVQEIKHEISN
jgi:predicted  nucleic acid-binding Zn-ribbon protein